MEEALKKVAADTELSESSVTLSIRDHVMVLDGLWKWDMKAQAVYCSDVMDFPRDFEGTKALIHPEDLARLSGMLELLSHDEPVLRCDFRIITTYGEVKHIHGQRIVVKRQKAILAEPLPFPEPWQEALEKISLQRANDVLQLRQDLSEHSEKLYHTGTWIINKHTGEAWYSDQVYRIHGLMPQSLNAHANTFNPFIHPDDRVIVLDAIEKAWVEEAPIHIEYRIIAADGQERYVQQATRWTWEHSGKLLFTGIIRDVTEERRLADQLLKESENAEFYLQIFRYAETQVQIAFWLVNLVTKKLSYSENFHKLYGFRQPLIPGLGILRKMVHPDDLFNYDRVMENMFRQHVLEDLEFRIIRPDGKTRILKQTGKVLVRPGEELTMIGLVQDITIHKSLERKIEEKREAIALLQALNGFTEKVNETCSIVWFPDGNLQWSEGLYKLLGIKYPSIEPGSKYLHRAIYPEDLEKFREAETLVMNSQHHEPFEFRLATRTGQRKMRIYFQQVVIEAKQFAIGILQDVTTESILQNNLQEAESMLETVSEAVNNMVLFTNEDHIILHWNREAAEKTGIPAEEALQKNLFEVLPSLHREDFHSQLHRALRGMEVKVERVSGGYHSRHHSYKLLPVRDSNGELTGVLHVAKDISRELELQQQLNERLNFIENLVEASVDRIVVLDRFMNYLYCNRKAEEYFSIQKDKVLGKNILEIFPSFRNHPGYQEFRKVLKGETVYIPPVASDIAEYFETYLTPVKDEEGNVFAVLWLVHDLTREYTLQQERAQALARLEEEHRRLKEAQNIGRVGSFEWNVASDVIYWSDEMYRIHGMEPQSEPITIEKVLEFIHPDDVQSSASKIMVCRRHPGNIQITHRIIRRNGEVRWVSRQLRSFGDEEGNVTYLSGTLQDITEQKIAQLELMRLKDVTTQQVTDRYLTVFNSIDEGFYQCEVLFDDQGRPADALYQEENPAAIRLTGNSYLGSKLSHSLPDQEFKNWLSWIAAVTVSGRSIRKQFYSHQYNKWFELFFSKIGNSDNHHVAIVFQDITERKLAEQNLRQSEEKFRSLVTTYAQSVWETDAEGQMVEDSMSWRNYTGQSFEEIQGEGWLNALHADEREEAMCKWREALELKQSLDVEYRLRHRDGGYRWTNIRATPIFSEEGTVVKWTGMNVDVHNRRQTEEDLKEAHRQLREFNSSLTLQVEHRTADLDEAQKRMKEHQEMLAQTAEASPDAITIYNLEYRTPVYLNNCLAEWTGISNEELIALGFEGRLQLIHPLDKKMIMAFNEGMLSAEDGDIQTIEYRLQTSKGLFWIRNRSKVFKRSQEGKPTHILSVLQDISEEMKLREQLLDRTKYAEEIIDASIDRIVVYDKDLNIIGWNQRSEIATGYSKSQVLGKKLWEVFPKLAEDQKIRTAIEQAGKGQYIYLPPKKANYSRGIYERFYIPLQNEKGETYAILNILHDVTDRLHKEEELMELNRTLEQKNAELEQKHDEITNFSFVASHDLKEPLRKIHTFSDWLIEHEKEQLSTVGKNFLAKIRGEANRIERLIGDILILTRIHSDAKKEEQTQLGELLEEVKEDMKDSFIKTQASLEIGELGTIPANRHQLFYLFKNLLSNAIKFQKPGNRPLIRISADVVERKHGAAILPRRFLKLSFSDNGFGFNQRYAKKIFQVFQRLHDQHEFDGTGIGLAICKKIMENHGGFITAESEPGKGSDFCCFFPLEADQIPSEVSFT